MNRPMLELRKELMALIEWEAEDFPCATQIDRRIEPDAVALAVEGPPALVDALNDVLRRKV
jgi:hypothetical protein